MVEFDGFGIAVSRRVDGGQSPTHDPVIAVNGEVDTATSPRLEEALHAAMDTGASVVMVDMTGVSFMDASGVGVLVSAASRARHQGGRVALCAPSPAVLRVLDATDLRGLLDVGP